MTSEGDAKLFLQALIQVAAACVHLSRGNGRAGGAAAGARGREARSPREPVGGINTDFLRKGIRQAEELLETGAAPGDAAKAIRL